MSTPTCTNEGGIAMIKNSLQKSHQRWVDDGCEVDWWDGLETNTDRFVDVSRWVHEADMELRTGVVN